MIVFLIWLAACITVTYLWGPKPGTADIAGLLGIYLLFGIMAFFSYLSMVLMF